jgi:hypothetical protein
MTDKLIDAIGMIDDEMLYEAEFSGAKRYPNLLRNLAAAVLILLILPSAVCGFQWIKKLSANAPDPAFRYAYHGDKLLMICRLDMNATDLQNQKNISDDYDCRELRAHVGAGIFGVEYADSEKVVITTGKGIFVYNYKSDYMINYYDLDEIGVPGFNQGDCASSISVDKSGEYCVMQSCDTWTSPEIEYRLIELSRGEIRKISEEELPESFEPVETEEIDLYSNENKSLPNTFSGSVSASYTDEKGEKYIFYTNIDSDTKNLEKEGKRALVGNTDLVIVKPDKTYTQQRIFGCMYEEFAK